jgi:D-ornithine---citrate ligase
MTRQNLYTPINIDDEQSNHFNKIATLITVKQLIQAALREDWVQKIPNGNKEWLIPFWRIKALVALKESNNLTLNRLGDLTQVLLLKHGHTKLQPVEKISDLLELLALESGESLAKLNWQLLLQELENSIANNALCLSYRDNWNQKLASQAQQDGGDNFWLWLRNHSVTHNSNYRNNGTANNGAIQDMTLFFEQWGAVGHPYHPCSKTKLGLTAEQVVQYSPEFQGKAQVQLVALARTHIQMQQGFGADNGALDWLEEIYPHWLKQWREDITALGLNIEHYAPIPVHPWQLEHEVKPRFSSLIASGHLLLLPNTGMEMAATMSFRTMAPLDDLQQPHIKLPVAIQATSAIRTVSPASVKMGTQISQVIANICRQEPQISQTLTLLPEQLGMHVEHESVPIDDRRFLSALFRTNPNSVLKPQETAVVVASLFVNSPLSQRPLFVDIISAAGAQSKAEITAYFTDYVRCLLQGHLDLYLLYGIALEAHQQNTLAVFDGQSKITRMLARDFGGVCIHAPTLTARGYQISAYPNAVTVTDCHDDARKKFIHAVLQSHVGEWVMYLAQEFDFTETQLWALVAEEIKQRFIALTPRLCPKYWQQESRALLLAPWQLKALMRMRINDDAHHYLYTEMANPLNHDSE